MSYEHIAGRCPSTEDENRKDSTNEGSLYSCGFSSERVARANIADKPDICLTPRKKIHQLTSARRFSGVVTVLPDLT